MENTSEKIFIGRQPILDSQQNIYAYELLFRGGLTENAARINGDEEATANVVVNALMGFGLDDIIGQSKAFINFSESFFAEEAEPCFPSERVICEVLETVPVTDQVVNGLNCLKKLGYKIALDDFVFKKEFIPFLKLADFIKLEVQNKDPKKLSAIVSKIKSVTNAELLAEKIEDEATYKACVEAGFKYFQGYYFSKPQVIEGKKLSVNALSLIELLKELANEDVALDELEHIVMRDLGLSHKIMRMAQTYKSINMPNFDTVKQAMQLFGLKRVKSWAMMISILNNSDGIPELFKQAIIRAAFARRLAKKMGKTNIDSYYLVGMFSLLNAILKQPMEDILHKLPLSDEMNTGLMQQTGNYGEVMKVVLAFEAFHELDEQYEDFRHDYLEAVKEANAMGLD